MANLITLSRLLLLIVVVVIAYRPPGLLQLVNVPLVILVFLTDGIDGYVARKRQETSQFGAMFDIAGDRIVELTLWIVLAHLTLVPVWVPLVFVVRGTIVDAIRASQTSSRRESPFCADGNCARQVAGGRPLHARPVRRGQGHGLLLAAAAPAIACAGAGDLARVRRHRHRHRTGAGLRCRRSLPRSRLAGDRRVRLQRTSRDSRESRGSGRSPAAECAAWHSPSSISTAPWLQGRASRNGCLPCCSARAGSGRRSCWPLHVSASAMRRSSAVTR